MKAALKRAFTENLGLKLVSVVLALVLWTVVMRINDPTIEKNFTTAVTIVNEDKLSEQGKYYNLAAGNTVTFKVAAKYSYMEKLAGTDFTAVADMANLESDSRIPVTVTANRYANNIQFMNSKQLYLYVDVGEEASERFVVAGLTKGSCADGYAVNSVSVIPNVITVKGPAELIASIANATATSDVSGITADLSESVVPVFYDSEGKAIDTTKLVRSVNTVNLSVDVVNVKDVQIQVKTTGTLGEGLYLDNIALTPNVIKVKGEPEAVNSVSVITLPSDLINLSNVAASYSTVIDINSYLPKGVSLVDKAQSSITLDVNLVGNKTAAFAIPTEQIYVHNLGEGLDAKFETETVTVQITGSNANLSQLANSLEGVTGYVDAVGLGEGAYELPLKLNLGREYYSKTVNARVILVKAERNPNLTPEESVAPSEIPSVAPETPVSQMPDAPESTASPSANGNH